MADEIENKDSHSGNTTVSSDEEKQEKQNVLKILFRMGSNRAREAEAVRGADQATLIEL